MPSNSFNLIPACCPVCQHSLAVPFFDGGNKPLATLGWPASVVEAQEMPCFQQNFVQCPHCSHVWNRSFSYEVIPYKKNPNRMFNNGGIWNKHLAMTRDLILSYLPEVPAVVDIGCGEGHFVQALEKSLGVGRFIGFDPNVMPESRLNVEYRSEYFEPLLHMTQIAPDAVLVRHVLEHMEDPAAFLEQLAWGAASIKKDCWLFAEVPCIDRALTTSRLADFFYEHASHFTTQSFQTLMARAGQVVELSHGYDDEVVFALIKLGVPLEAQCRARYAHEFEQAACANLQHISQQIDNLAVEGKRVAIWGGTGKCAAFIHQYGVDALRFPLVVDSDLGKVGTFVPGSGQEIMFRDVLKATPAEVIIIPTQWRARDIVAEMARENITANQILIEHNGMLVDFNRDAHPY